MPFVRIVSCQPLEMKGPTFRRPTAGYPPTTPATGTRFVPNTTAPTAPTWQAYNEWVQSLAARPLADLEFIPESVDLNLYTYPEVIDYTDRRPWHRTDIVSIHPFDPTIPVRSSGG